jgi:hypothetical protein
MSSCACDVRRVVATIVSAVRIGVFL